MSSWDCNVCRADGASFSVPADRMGIAVMQEHLYREHGAEHCRVESFTFASPEPGKPESRGE